MRQLFKALLWIAVCLPWVSSQLSAQEYQDTLTSLVAKGEAVRFNLEWTAANHGSIQWQNSPGNDIWTDLAGGTSKFIRFNADTGALFRARVVSGTCDPFYSRITRLEVLDISTVKTDSITDTEAVIFCSLDDKAITYGDWGVLVDTKIIPDASSVSIPGNTGPPFSVRLSELLPGKKYYVRAFVKLPDGALLMGNILDFTTLNIEALNRINVTDSSAAVWYKITGDTADAVHGVFYGTNPLPDSTSANTTGLPDGEGWKTSLTGLLAGEMYYVRPYIRIYGRHYFGNTVSLRTYSDYSGETVDDTPFTPAHKIVWDAYATAQKISQPGVYADYGRVRRIGKSDTLLLVYHGGPNNQDWVNVYLRKSYNNGVTWQDHKVLADISKYTNYWRFCNPELIELKNGWLLLAYTANGKPETNENCYLHLLTSKDRGETWEGPLLIQTGRSWEPAMVQLPNGEIEMVYSSEARWWPPVSGVYTQQEIHMIHSTDNGITWSFPQSVAYYPGRRDGMPVPLLLQGNKGVVFAIETVNSGTSPYIIKRDLAGPWKLTVSDFENSTYRWLAGNFSGHGGAPYLIQLPTGETVLSVHVYRGGDWHQNNYMQVMLGDNEARHFGNLSTPWGVLPANESAVNNSLFLMDNTTIMAVSGRNFPDGSGGIYWLRGTIVPIN